MEDSIKTEEAELDMSLPANREAENLDSSALFKKDLSSPSATKLKIKLAAKRKSKVSWFVNGRKNGL